MSGHTGAPLAPEEFQDRPLTAPLPLGGSVHRPALLFLALVALLWGTDALIDPMPGPLARWASRRNVAILAFALALALLGGWALALLCRRWLTVTLRGFVVGGWGSQPAVADEQVTAMSQ